MFLGRWSNSNAPRKPLCSEIVSESLANAYVSEKTLCVSGEGGGKLEC